MPASHVKNAGVFIRKVTSEIGLSHSFEIQTCAYSSSLSLIACRCSTTARPGFGGVGAGVGAGVDNGRWASVLQNKPANSMNKGEPSRLIG